MINKIEWIEEYSIAIIEIDKINLRLDQLKKSSRLGFIDSFKNKGSKNIFTLNFYLTKRQSIDCDILKKYLYFFIGESR